MIYLFCCIVKLPSYMNPNNTNLFTSVFVFLDSNFHYLRKVVLQFCHFIQSKYSCYSISWWCLIFIFPNGQHNSDIIDWDLRVYTNYWQKWNIIHPCTYVYLYYRRMSLLASVCSHFNKICLSSSLSVWPSFWASGISHCWLKSTNLWRFCRWLRCQGCALGCGWSQEDWKMYNQE